ncbi:MAG: SDR family oxidoreductase [Chloroflexi bacterium]|nr:SDR family oxidoreductase [Chloroflexota bacterium]
MSDQSLFSLQGRVAIVTGAGKGIGRAIALGLADAGADVVAVARTQSDIDAVAGEVKAKGRLALAARADVTVAGQVDHMVRQTMDAFGHIDILMNNVGGGAYCEVLDMDEKTFDAMMALNLKSAYLCSRAVGKVMVQQRRGSIVNFSSGTSTWARKGLAHYGASKAAVHIFSQAFAIEVGKHNVRVNVLMPGTTETPLTKEYYATRPDDLKQGLAKIPLGRLGQPDDYVGTAIYLASDASAFVTGAIICVRGGAI